MGALRFALLPLMNGKACRAPEEFPNDRHRDCRTRPLELSERPSNLVEARLHLTGLDICLHSLAGLVVFGICAIARTAIRDARRSRRGVEIPGPLHGQDRASRRIFLTRTEGAGAVTNLGASLSAARRRPQGWWGPITVGSRGERDDPRGVAVGADLLPGDRRLVEDAQSSPPGRHVLGQALERGHVRLERGWGRIRGRSVVPTGRLSDSRDQRQCAGPALG